MQQGSWEQIAPNTHRLPVFGGWLVRYEDFENQDLGGHHPHTGMWEHQTGTCNYRNTMIFIPDPKHIWTLVEELKGE